MPVIGGQGRASAHWEREFVDAFSHLQKQIDMLLQSYLEAKTPVLGKRIAKNHFTRLRDEDRWSYVKALAEEVAYSDNLDSASMVWARCRDVRDELSHPASKYYKGGGSERKRSNVPQPLTDEVLQMLVTQCDWINHLVVHLINKGGVPIHAMGGPPGTYPFRELEILPPPRLESIPAGWNSREANLSRDKPTDPL